MAWSSRSTLFTGKGEVMHGVWVGSLFCVGGGMYSALATQIFDTGGTRVRTLPDPYDSVSRRAVASLNDGYLFTARTTTGVVEKWDPSTGSLIGTIGTPAGGVSAMFAMPGTTPKLLLGYGSGGVSVRKVSDFSETLAFNSTQTWDPMGGWTTTTFTEIGGIFQVGTEIFVTALGQTGVSVHNAGTGAFIRRIGQYTTTYDFMSPPPEVDLDFINPAGVAVINSKVYATGTYPSHALYRCNLDGTSREMLTIDADSTRPYGIAAKAGSNNQWVLNASTGAAVVYGDPSPPTASASIAKTYRHVDVTDTSTDADNDLATVKVNWGDGSEEETFDAPGGSLDHDYPHANDTYTITITATDEGGLTGVWTGDVAISITPPLASGTLTQKWRTVSLLDTSNDPDGTIASVSVNWGDGTSPVSGPAGTNFSHRLPYNALPVTYTVVLTATDNEGDTDTASFTVTVNPFSGDWTLIVDPTDTSMRAIADASTLTPPTGETIESYSWDWGDGSDPSLGPFNVHTYVDKENYNITLTVTLVGGETFQSQKGTTVATITSISPLKVKAGDSVVIKGTSLGTTGTATIGGAEVTTPTFTATQITLTVPALAGMTPRGGSIGAPGPMDIVLTGDDDYVITIEGGVTVVDDTNSESLSEVLLGRMKRVYVNGVHVGYTEEDFSIQPTMEKFDWKPNSALSKMKVFITEQSMNIKFTISQVNAKNLALAFGVTVEADNKTIILKRQEYPKEFSVVAEDALGIVYSFPRVVLTTPGDLTLQSGVNKKIATEWEALPVLANGEERFGYIQWP